MRRGQNYIKPVIINYTSKDLVYSVKSRYEADTGKKITYNVVSDVLESAFNDIYDELTKYDAYQSTTPSIRLGKLGKIYRTIEPARYISNNIENSSKNKGKVVAPARYTIKFKIGANLKKESSKYARKSNGSFDYGHYNNVSSEKKLFNK